MKNRQERLEHKIGAWYYCYFPAKRGGVKEMARDQSEDKAVADSLSDVSVTRTIFK